MTSLGEPSNMQLVKIIVYQKLSPSPILCYVPKGASVPNKRYENTSREPQDRSVPHFKMLSYFSHFFLVVWEFIYQDVKGQSF